MHETQQSPRRAWKAPAAILLAPVMIVLSLSGCQSDSEPAEKAEAALTTGEFVEIVTQIREAERAVSSMDIEDDSIVALFQLRKDSILSVHDVTEEELRSFLAEQGQDVVVLQAVWDSLTDRLKHVPASPDPRESGLGRRMKQ